MYYSIARSQLLYPIKKLIIMNFIRVLFETRNKNHTNGTYSDK